MRIKKEFLEKKKKLNDVKKDIVNKLKKYASAFI